MFEIFYLLDKIKIDMYVVIISVYWPKLGGARMLLAQAHRTNFLDEP